MTEIIRVAAALIVDDAGRLLLVRKRDTTVFMQPGGKYEPGESGAQTLVRELNEELGLVIDTAALEPLGTFTAPAANEAGMLVEAEVFRVSLGDPTTDPSTTARTLAAGAEIAELRWVHPDQFREIALAPLVTEHMMALIIAPRTPLTIVSASLVPWSALERVLDATAESRHCWCRWWLTTNAEYSALNDTQRHEQAAAAHATSNPRGLLAMRDHEPVGWVSVAPRRDYARLPRTRMIADGSPDTDFTDPAVWSIVCFTVAPAHRKHGVARALLTAAIAHAAAAGAERIEAYPVDTVALSATGRATSDGDLNTGTLGLFASAGFVEVGRPKPARPIVQLTLSDTGGRRAG